MKTVKHLVDKYYNYNDFKMLRSRTKKDYQYFLSVMVADFGSVNFCELTSKQAKHAYEGGLSEALVSPTTYALCHPYCFGTLLRWSTRT